MSKRVIMQEIDNCTDCPHHRFIRVDGIADNSCTHNDGPLSLQGHGENYNACKFEIPDDCPIPIECVIEGDQDQIETSTDDFDSGRKLIDLLSPMLGRRYMRVDAHLDEEGRCQIVITHSSVDNYFFN